MEQGQRTWGRDLHGCECAGDKGFLLGAGDIQAFNPGDGGLEFWGASFVCDPFGVVVAQASRTDEQVLVAACDLAHLEDVRRNWPFLRDRRIDAYAPITKRFLDP